MKNTYMVNAICYKVDKPIIYNEGTPYERRFDTFLAYYGNRDYAKAQKEVDEINQGIITTLPNGQSTDIEHRHYYVNIQPAIDTMYS